MMYARKGVAIPYIVALVIGIVIIAFVVYWVYKSFSSEGIECNTCKAKFLDWCSLCASANAGKENWNVGVGILPLDIAECADKCKFHSKEDDCLKEGSGCDIFLVIRCVAPNPPIRPCITCAALNVKIVKD